MPPLRTYLRFQTPLRESDAPGPLGVFRAAGLIQDRGGLTPWDETRLSDLLEWWNKKLPVPRLEPRQWRARFWFRSDAADLVRRLWELVHLLRDNGVPVEFKHTQDPGMICYEDRYQIAAVAR